MPQRAALVANFRYDSLFAMKASLQLRLSQHLALTPQLQQSIRLLQMSTLELTQEVATAIAQNPLLENDDDWIASPLRVAADGSVIAQTPASSAPEPMAGAPNGTAATNERTERDETAGVDEYDSYSADGGDASQWNLDDFGRSPAASDDDDLPPMQIHETSTSLRDHLMAQLRVTQASPRDRALVTFLIESLDDDGYLSASLEEVLADLPAELEVDVDELNAALALVHSFDPAGVGARSASECLKLQLLRLDPSPTRALALDIVSQHLELLAARDFTRLRTQLKATDDALRDAHAAKNVGVPVRRVMISLFVLTAFCACLFAVLQVADIGSAAADRGLQKEFEAIIAAVIGGTLLTGGYGSVIGAAFGALIFGVVQIGITYTNISSDWFRVFLGVMLLVAVLFNHYVRRRVSQS